MLKRVFCILAILFCFNITAFATELTLNGAVIKSTPITYISGYQQNNIMSASSGNGCCVCANDIVPSFPQDEEPWVQSYAGWWYPNGNNSFTYTTAYLNLLTWDVNTGCSLDMRTGWVVKQHSVTVPVTYTKVTRTGFYYERCTRGCQYFSDSTVGNRQVYVVATTTEEQFTEFQPDNSITSVVFKNCKTDGVNLTPSVEQKGEIL